MKKRKIFIVLIVILTALFLSSWFVINYIAKTLKYGSYYMEADTEPGISPFVTISENQMSFTYDLLSNNLSVGDYSIEDDELTMTTYDGNEKFVFQIDGDTLIFLEDRSSPVKLKNENLGIKVTDKAKFRLKR